MTDYKFALKITYLIQQRNIQLYQVKDRIWRCRYLNIFTYTDDGVGYVRLSMVKECPAGLENQPQRVGVPPRGLKYEKKANVKVRKNLELQILFLTFTFHNLITSFYFDLCCCNYFVDPYCLKFQVKPKSNWSVSNILNSGQLNLNKNIH